MKKTPFNSGWTCEAYGKTENVTLPHDYMIGTVRKAENATGLDLGYFEPGFGVYRKTFEKPEGETVLLSFDGAMGLCEVSLNREHAAFHPYGYTAFLCDLTPYLRDGENELTVTADTRAQVSSRWYTGGGLYRSVELLTAGKTYLEPNGIFVKILRLYDGAASAEIEIRVRILKENGFNAIRTAHNPPSSVMLDVCDRMGMLVIDEIFDCWRFGKRDFDYHRFFDGCWEEDTRSMVLRDRNHPSVVLWSTGNEIAEQDGASDGYRVHKGILDTIRSLDPTRPVTQAFCPFWENPEMDRRAREESGFGPDRRQPRLHLPRLPRVPRKTARRRPAPRGSGRSRLCDRGRMPRKKGDGHGLRPITGKRSPCML